MPDAHQEPLRDLPNRLLAGLSRSHGRRLSPHLEDLILGARQVLYEPGEPLEHVYFPCGAVISLSAVMSDGRSVQTAMIGNEGMVGVSEIAGTAYAPGRALCQITGRAKRISARDLARGLDLMPDLRRLVGHHMRSLIIQLNQSAACNCLHSIEQRCARWLLMTADRVGASSFTLTQEFLASMLGVRRASVSEAAAHLQDKKLIRYSRGHLTILDRRGLTAAACECYGIIREASERLAS